MLGIAAVLTATIMAVSGSAAADNFAVNPTHGDNPNVGDCDNQNLTSHVCVADSTVHTVGMDLGPLMTEATNATLFESYDTTNLTIVDGSKEHTTARRLAWAGTTSLTSNPGICKEAL